MTSPDSKQVLKKTTIQLDDATRDDVNNLKRGKMTQNDVIKWLIAFYKKATGNTTIITD